jgi:Zn-dependent peptidase ImmA (M78 family)
MSIKIVTENESNRFMLVNSDHSIGKQHFTICHELYHLYFQTNFQSKISCAGLFDKKGDPEEYNADVFASCILLPQMGVYKMIPDEERSKNKITIPTLLAIEQYYGCSHSALLHRLLNLNLIDKDHKEKFQNIGITNLARKLGYNTSLYEKGNNGEVIGKYGTLAYTSWERGIVSESSYYGLLSDLGIDVSKLDDVQINGDL